MCRTVVRVCAYRHAGLYDALDIDSDVSDIHFCVKERVPPDMIKGKAKGLFVRVSECRAGRKVADMFVVAGHSLITCQ